jgi:hypothetical protein
MSKLPPPPPPFIHGLAFSRSFYTYVVKMSAEMADARKNQMMTPVTHNDNGTKLLIVPSAKKIRRSW